MFYFAWVAEQEPFDATAHARQDESILHFDVQHQEGCLPLLRLTVPLVHHTPRPVGQRGILWWQPQATPQILFDGRLGASPAEKREDFILLILSGGGEAPQKRLAQALESQKKDGWEPLWVPEKDHHQVEEILEGLAVVPHWHRVTGALSLRKVGEPQQVLEWDGDFFPESLQMRDKGRPLKALKLAVTAEWVQRYDGVVSLNDCMEQAGTWGYLSTLTPQDFQARWWKKNHPLRRTGYEIMESHVHKVMPPSTGGLDCYPTKSASFTVRGRPTQVPRAWMKPTLKVQWHYRQKRAETVDIRLPGSDRSGLGEKVNLRVRLQDISTSLYVAPWCAHRLYEEGAWVEWQGHLWKATQRHLSGQVWDPQPWEMKSQAPHALDDPSRWSFFETPRGHQVVRHALKQAQTYVQRRARTLEVSFRTAFGQGATLMGHESLRVRDPRLPNGEVTGQVVHYALVAEGNTGEHWAQVTLAVCPTPVPRWHLRGLSLTTQPQGMLNPGQLGPAEMITSLSLTHAAEDQNKTLEGKDFPTLAAVQTALEKTPTRLRIELRDLKSLGTLTHRWKAEVAEDREG
ncbi:MAG: hypothetical protein ACK5PQ_00490 [Alphaproteobacteria bacterium]